MIPVVTIDGPAASGKSSVSRELARRLHWNWVSTGAFYRGLAYVAFRKQTDLNNEEELAELAKSNSWSVQMTPEMTEVWLDGSNVTDDINREEVGNLASKTSGYPAVRKALLNAQRNCADGVAGLVAEGRDCGTVIFPQAEVKFFLTARAEDRAARRARDEGKTVEETQDAQKVRDTQDANRKAAPMLAAPDAHMVDTTEMDFLQVVDAVEAIVRAQLHI
jgi:cytidylate kinase